MKRISFIVGIALLFSFVCCQMGQAEEQFFERKMIPVGQRYVPDEIIVKFKPGVREDVIASLNRRHEAVAFYKSRLASFRRLRIPAGKTVSEMVERYRRDPNVEYAEPNYIAYASMVPSDPFYSYQWHMQGINMEAAWDIETGDPDVVVAVLDTGVAFERYTEKLCFLIWCWDAYYEQAPDLDGTRFVAGYDFVNNDNHPNDDNGHGTHVTGTIAQSTNNGEGVAGVAFNCSIMPVKVLDSSGMGTYADIADGIRWAAEEGADIINLSLGGSQPSTTLENACAYAYNNGVTIVCAAGNDGQDTVSYPAAYDAYCIAVGATDYNKALTYYSNYGESLDLVAPGGDLDVDQNGDIYGDGVLQQTFEIYYDGAYRFSDWGYWFYEGTSMAAPHVSGVAALLISSGVATMPDEVREALESTAENIGDPRCGSGLVDAYAALNYAGEPLKAPWVETHPATNVAQNSATLNGALTDPGTAESVTVSFVYGTSSGNYDHETGSVTITQPESLPVPFTADVSGLSTDTTYYFRAKAQGDGGTLGDEMTFTTESAPASVVPTAYITIEMSKQSFWKRWRAAATITVTDASGAPLTGATVEGRWSEAYTGDVSGTTNGGARVSFRTRWIRGSGQVCFTVDRLMKDGQEYDLDGETTDCISSDTN